MEEEEEVQPTETNNTDVEKRFRLLYAVRENDERKVLESIKSGVDIDFAYDRGKTALFYAAMFSSKEIVQALIDAGADVNITDDEGKTPLFYCAAQNKVMHRVGLEILKAGDEENSGVDFNYSSVASTLIKAGAEINITDNQEKTALMYFLRKKNPDLACALIEAGADVNTTDKEGRTALIYWAQDPMTSIYANTEKVASALIKAGANINLMDNEGNTALMYSLQNKSKELACALIEAGADVNMTDKKGRTALIYWAQVHYDSYPDDDDFDYDDMMRMGMEIGPTDYKTVAFKILNAGADINMADNEGKTALMYFLQRKNTDLACSLIEAGAGVNMTDEKGRTALICWARGMNEYDRYFSDNDDVYVEDEIMAMKKTDAMDYKTVAFKILNAGADINMADNEGKTALMYFLQNENIDLACTLIKAGADVNVTDNEGRTALIYFAGNQIESRELPRTGIFRYHGDNHAPGEDDDCERVAFMIIKASTDINVIDKEGKTALIYSLQANIGGLTRKLIDAGADINVVDKDGKTALVYAAINSYESACRYKFFSCRYYSSSSRHPIAASIMDTVRLDRENIIKLIEAGADVNAKDHEGKTALMHYAENECIDMILEHEGKLQDELSECVKQAQDDYNIVASALIQASSNVNTVDNQGKTALTYFLQNNKDCCASTLIKAGGNASIIDRDGKTALFYARKSCQNVFLDNLIETVTDINITDNERRTALMFAVQNNESLAFALIEAGADVKAVDKNGRNALFFASVKGNENMVSKLIKSIDINHTDNQGKTALLHAVQHSQTRVVAKLIEAGADVNVTDQQGRTALIYYALDETATGVFKMYQMSSFREGDPAKTDLKCLSSMLVKAGANLDMTDNEGKTALMYSLQNGRKDLACELIKAGADVNVTDKVGRSALIYCALEDMERRERMITQHYIFGLDDDPDDYPAIETESVASMLINAGAILDIADYDGKTALMYSLQSNNENLACELIDAGTDVKVTDGDGKTALMHFAQVGMPSTKEGSSHSYLPMSYFYGEYPENIDTSDSKRVASALIKAGVDIDITDDEGKTALIYSLLSNRESLACALIEAGADVKTTDKNGKTALFYALFSSSERRFVMSISEGDEEASLTDTLQDNRESVITKLIEAGADVNITYDEGKTVLMYSIEKRNENLACLLIEAGAGVNVTDNEGKTALIHCSQENNQNILWGVRLNYRQNNVQNKEVRSIACALIKAGADVNITDNQGKTALIYCVENNYENMVSVLIEAGADVNIADHDGGTALVYGVGNESIVRKLIMNGNAQVNKRDRYGRLPLFYAITESLTSARHLLERSVLRRKDNRSMLSFFVEECLRRRRNCSYMSEGFNVLKEKGVQREAIFEALINSVFCRILLTTLELRESKKSGSHSQSLSQKTEVKKIFQALNLAKKYIADDTDRKCQSIQNIIMMIEETTDLCTTVAKIVDSLLELGANPCYADIYGNTALHYAVCLPFAGVPRDTVMELCDQMDEYGASVRAKNHQNETPLLFCLSKVHWVGRSDHKSSKVKLLVEVCRFLLEQGSSVEETALNGKSIFHLIIQLFHEGFRVRDDTIRKVVLNDCLTLLQLFPSSLVKKEGMVNKRDSNFNCPLHLWAMLEFILPLKKDNDAVDLNAFEMQILASVFKHLLACGAKLNDRNEIEQTPLHLCQTWTAAKLLIQAGANTTVVDSDGSSPLLVALERNRFLIESDANCIYPDVLQQPKEFWKTVVEKKLDPWVVNSLGKSVMSILVRSEAFVLAKTLIEVTCEGNFIQKDATAVSLLNAICKDQSTRAQWKSILVEQILKSRIITLKDREDTPLHFCCRNIVREIEMVFPPRRRHLSHIEDSFINDMMTSIHWTIVKQLLLHGFSSQVLDSSDHSCIDIAKKCPALKDLLTKPLNINEVPLVIPWKSISKTHKNALAKVARRQKCRQVNSFWYHENNIQKGSFGLVFVGINEKDGREVAIKRIEKLRMHRPADKREITNLTKLADCEQVVRYLVVFEDKDFSYIVLELMEGNLKDYLESTDYDAKKSIQLCADVVKGLKYLHEQNIIHRDLKPSNILYKTFPNLCFKIADFGLSRCIDKCSTSATVLGSVAGTRCWIAPEVLASSYKEHSMASDVFSCGLVLHYIQVKRHPFSPADCANKIEQQICNEIENNVLKDNKEGWDASLCPEATELLRRMLDNDRIKRPTAAEALLHPFFWSKKKKMELLISVGNQPEFECPRANRTLPLTQLEKDLDKNFGTIVTKTTWDDAGFNHMPAIYDEMTRKRKYCTTSVVELVRFIRNTHAHVSDDNRPTSIRKLVLEDFVFLEHFPKLVMEVLKSVKTHGWDSREEIKYALDDAVAKGCDEGLPGEPSSKDSKRKHPKPQY